MRYYDRPEPAISFTPPLKGAVRFLLVFTGVVLLSQGLWRPLTGIFALHNSPGFHFWQLFTSIFLHGDAMHFGLNMFLLWVLGSAVEDSLGSARFLTLYLSSGMFGNLAWILFGLSPPHAITIGASGAVFGILFAFARLFPERELLVFFVFPMKARIFVILIGAIELWSSIQASQDGVAHALHLFGALGAVLYLEVFLARRIPRSLHRWIDELHFRYRTRHLTVIEGGKGQKDELPVAGEDSHFFENSDDPDTKGPVIN